MDFNDLKEFGLVGVFLASVLSVSSFAAIPMAEEKKQVFAAAGFKYANGAWRAKCSFGHIPVLQDINQDGRLDAIVRDGGTECYGSTGVGFYLVTKQKNGKWTRIFNSPGEPVFLKTRGRHGWPELLVKNSSQCHTVYSWNGSQFVKVRQQYQGKTCK